MRSPDADMPITLSELADGAVEERFKLTIARVLENLMDPNTSHKKARKVTVTFTLKTNEARQFAEYDVSVVPTFAPAAPVQGGLLLKTDASGFTVAVEPKQEKLPLENALPFPKGTAR